MRGKAAGKVDYKREDRSLLRRQPLRNGLATMTEAHLGAVMTAKLYHRVEKRGGDKVKSGLRPSYIDIVTTFEFEL